MRRLRLAIAGLGNCASSLIQGSYYFRDNQTDLGLLYPEIGGYNPQDLEQKNRVICGLVQNLY